MGWDKFVDSLTEGDFLSGAFSTVATTALGLLGLDQQEQQAKDAKDESIRQQQLQLQLEALKARYAPKGGGGGGGASTALTKAQKLAAIQNQNDLKVQAINNLIAGMQNSYLGGG